MRARLFVVSGLWRSQTSRAAAAGSRRERDPTTRVAPISGGPLAAAVRSSFAAALLHCGTGGVPNGVSGENTIPNPPGATDSLDSSGPPPATDSAPPLEDGATSGAGADASVVSAGGNGPRDAMPDTAIVPIAEGGSVAIGNIHNPILPGFNADPQIAMFNGKFYIYPTTDGIANGASSSFSVFSSSDLATWHSDGVILNLVTDVTWAKIEAWSPGIAHVGGTYYFYFTANWQIGVAMATSPDGPFHDALGHPLVTTGQYGTHAIDPNAFVDDDGRAYLYFGNGGARVVQLNSDMVSFKGAPKDITTPGFREASVGFKRNGIYYFMWSEGNTATANYLVSYAMGTSAMGPFTRAANNPVLQRDNAPGILGPGSNSVLQLPNGDWYIVYHRLAIPNGDGEHRQVCIDRLLFNPDGTIIPVKPTL
jgi:Glycosyl hydrolases family 43